jgi:cytochrome c5
MKKCFIILLAGMVACHSSKKITATKKPPEVNTELQHAQAKVPGITMERLTSGGKVYAQDCARCHSLKEPSNYTMEQWDPILKSMYKKAKLTDENEKTLIRDYVMAKSK